MSQPPKLAVLWDLTFTNQVNVKVYDVSNVRRLFDDSSQSFLSMLVMVAWLGRVVVEEDHIEMITRGISIFD